MTRLTDAFLDGSIDKVTYEERKSDLLAQKTGVQNRLENDEDSTFWGNVSQKFEQGLTAYTGYLRGLDAEKRDMVKLVSSNLVMHGKEPVFPMVFPFEEIRKWSKSTYGAPYQGAVRTLGTNVSQTDILSPCAPDQGAVRKCSRTKRNISKLFMSIARHQPEVVSDGYTSK